MRGPRGPGSVVTHPCRGGIRPLEACARPPEGGLAVSWGPYSARGDLKHPRRERSGALRGGLTPRIPKI